MREFLDDHGEGIHHVAFDTEAATTTCFETYHFPDDFVSPEPQE